MTEIETLTQRIDALEMRIAHQDQIIEELNGAYGFCPMPRFFYCCWRIALAHRGWRRVNF